MTSSFVEVADVDAACFHRVKQMALCGFVVDLACSYEGASVYNIIFAVPLNTSLCNDSPLLQVF